MVSEGTHWRMSFRCPCTSSFYRRFVCKDEEVWAACTTRCSCSSVSHVNTHKSFPVGENQVLIVRFSSPVLGVEERCQLAARDAGTDGHLVAGTAYTCFQETAVGIRNERAAD